MIVWTEYMKYRAEVRGFSLVEVERILRHSDERYYDVSTGRHVVIGRHEKTLVIVPYDKDGERIIPVTVHPTSRQQVSFRVHNGRFVDE